jgi:two-component system, NtrC family, response regulator
MANILIVDDDEMLCDMFSRKIRNMGHEVECALTLKDGVGQAKRGSYDVVFLDVRMPDGNGLDAIPAIRETSSCPEIIIMTGMGDPDGVELAIRSGVWDYLEKPSSIDMMILPLVRALQYREVKGINKPSLSLKTDGIVGSSQNMKACLEQVAVAAGSTANVLITGETGTGKELLSWAIHNNSPRVSGNFVVVDCAAMPDNLVESMLFGYEKGAYTGADKPREGLVKHAHGGTLFLDEVAELPMLIQKSFLRVLQEHRFRPLGSNREVESDFRLIAATNRNLDRMVKEGRFREDLLFRLRSISIEIPPLRARKKDIPELGLYYAGRFCERFGSPVKKLSPEFLESLGLYEWPGNVRELVNTIERSLAVAGSEDVLVPRHFPDYIRIKITQKAIAQRPGNHAAHAGPAPRSSTMPSLQEVRNNALSKAEREYLKDLFVLTGNNISQALKISGLAKSRFYELMKKYRLGPQNDSHNEE